MTKPDYEQIAAFIAQHTRHRPQIAIVLGSGYSALADEITDADTLSYADIPGFQPSTVEGHRGQLVIGTLENTPVFVMQGRVHYYEGFSPEEVTLPIRVMYSFGIDTVILTNAAGGLNPGFQPGDLMLIEDQINLVGMIGHNPLMGPNDPSLGPRFPDMITVYDRRLRELTIAVAAELGQPLRRGVYVGLSGPAFETPAEVRFVRLIGGDATGMSTTNEALVARHAGMRVLGLSGISNVAVDAVDTPRVTSHAEVLEAGAVIVPRMLALLRGLMRRWPEAA